MAFFKQARYESKVWTTVWVTLFILDAEIHKKLKQYPGIKTALRTGFYEKRNKDELGVEISAIILARSIEEVPDESRCERIAHNLREWQASPDSLSSFGADPSSSLTHPNVDVLLWGIQWGIWWVSKLLKDGRIDEYYLGWFASKMIGALEGKQHEERSEEGIIIFIRNVLAYSVPKGR